VRMAGRHGGALTRHASGGALPAAAITPRPVLHRDAIIGSPLFHMQRYSHLRAGAA